MVARCRQGVPAKDRERGEAYFAQGRVWLSPAVELCVNGVVEGSGRNEYQVCLDWSEANRGKLLVDCECPRFESEAICKHIWAALLKLDAEGLVDEQIPGGGSLRLVPLPYAVFDEILDDGPGRAPWPDEGVLPRASDQWTGVEDWRFRLRRLRTSLTDGADAAHPPTRRRIAWYLLQPETCRQTGRLVIDLQQQQEKRNGDLGKRKKLSLSRTEIESFTEAEDRELLDLLCATAGDAREGYRHDYYAFDFSSTISRGTIPAMLFSEVLPRLCATGRFGLQPSRGRTTAEPKLLTWDDGEPWSFRLRLETTSKEEDDSSSETAHLRGLLSRGEEERSLDEPELLLASGLVVFRESVARLQVDGTFPWIAQLRRSGDLRVPTAQLPELLGELWSLPELPALELPEAWRVEERLGEPEPCLELLPAGQRRRHFEGWVSFDYEGHRVLALSDQPALLLPDKRCRLLRDKAAERAALEQLAELGLGSSTGQPLRIAPESFTAIVEQLLAAGWKVEVEQRSLRRASSASLRVRSGIDWLDLHGELTFDSASVALPAVLASLRRGERWIPLGDGSSGLLPEAWLQRYRGLARLSPTAAGSAAEAGPGDDAVRFLPSQALLLDALLEAEGQVQVDRSFVRLRDRLAGGATSIEPHREPRGFHGELRPYQRRGLGWLRFLQEVHLGGCLADDMGLGKTIQVLALLQQRRLRPVGAAQKLPSLVVVPRSLLHNWRAEAERFTPRLRLLTYAGPGRDAQRAAFAEHDVVVTTYGTLRRDVLALRELRFDYVILDEAQAIKNPKSQAAKACRLLPAAHRLVLTGTPAENHLGDLWSLFEFLNPGMLGRLSAMGNKGPANSEQVEQIARALGPFILRRSKEQVLSELPEKSEQVLFCELERKQRKLYDQMRQHYRTMLGQKIDTVGLGQAKIHVLEALLRLRQAACHPGLLDRDRCDEPGAKLETLLEQLQEVRAAGHKALVFSQFTRLLAIVRQRLDSAGISYEYLDGRTRQRGRKVERFQQDPSCSVFLVSLKAGGVGLNLTSASYVYLLDPWWNPAVEAQAVDRAHRIGQRRPVFAYRLIARDTIEEKMLELQRGKRELAATVLGSERSLLAELTAADLEWLFS